MMVITKIGRSFMNSNITMIPSISTPQPPQPTTLFREKEDEDDDPLLKPFLVMMGKLLGGGSA